MQMGAVAHYEQQMRYADFILNFATLTTMARWSDPVQCNENCPLTHLDPGHRFRSGR